MANKELPRLTTAQWRAKAEVAEELRRWGPAADMYDLAADNYPEGRGALRDADIALLRRKARECRAMLKA